MAISEYNRELPSYKRKEIVYTLSEKTMSSPNVVYQWLTGRITPPAIKRQIVSQVLGLSEAELWPTL